MIPFYIFMINILGCGLYIELTQKSYQIDREANHNNDREQLKEFHPYLDFKKHNEIY